MVEHFAVNWQLLRETGVEKSGKLSGSLSLKDMGIRSHVRLDLTGSETKNPAPKPFWYGDERVQA